MEVPVFLDRDFIRRKKEMTEAMIVSSVFAFSVCVSVSHLQVTVFDLGTKYFGRDEYAIFFVKNLNISNFKGFFRLFLLCLCICHRPFDLLT